MNGAKDVDGVQALEALEAVYRRDGLAGVARYVEEEFPLGSLVSASAAGAGTRTYRICDRVVWHVDQHGAVSEDAVLAPQPDRSPSCGLIRVLALTYVASPFQVELYGEPHPL